MLSHVHLQSSNVQPSDSRTRPSFAAFKPKMPPPKTHYLSIDESQGETHTPTVDKPYIGTHRLITCVGVYIPISDNRCFLAHINAYVKKPGTEYGQRLVTAEQGRQIREEVLKRLRKHSEEKSWTVQEVVEYLKAGGRKIVLMCPNFNRAEGNKTLSGKFIVEAIRDFLGRQSDLPVEEHFNNEEQQGFVVYHITSEVHILPQHWQKGADGLSRRWDNQSDEKWVRDPTTWKKADEWHIIIEPGSWWRPGTK